MPNESLFELEFGWPPEESIAHPSFAPIVRAGIPSPAQLFKRPDVPAAPAPTIPPTEQELIKAAIARGETLVTPGAVPAAVAAIPAAAGALGLPAGIVGLLGAAATGYGIYQALGGGEGEGLFGLDILGGDGQKVVGGVPLGGPGLAEPSADVVLKEWHIRFDSKQGDFKCQYYLVQTPRGKKILMYNQRTRAWKHWRPARLAVIGKNMPSHRMVTRLRRNIKRHVADAKTILQLGSPTAYAKQLGYRKYKRRR